MSEIADRTVQNERERPHRYDAALANRIELKWQHYWKQHATFTTPNPGEAGFDAAKAKRYVLDMFPFPSGAGLHVGHPRGYIATDVYARFFRMSGYNVLHTMGFDAFGLPAEQFAIETGTHPRTSTERNIEAIRQQLERIGLAHDPRRRLATTDISFVRWTQWIFLQIFNAWYDDRAGRARPIADLVAEFDAGSRSLEGDEMVAGRTWSSLTEVEQRQVIDRHRLAYLGDVTVNWCPALGTVLANEEVTKEGRSERGNHPVSRRPLRQWMLRITAYAERLGADLDLVNWPESIKAMQRNWIGRSDGAEVGFRLVLPSGDEGPLVNVFTTRPDTLFGATYLVLAPEHPLVEAITTATQKDAVADYKAEAVRKSDLERTGLEKAKTGVFTGVYAINPVNGERIPVWVADYVLVGYGTGAIMAVPAHDERDFEFAKQHGLKIKVVIVPDEKESWWLERPGDPDSPLSYEQLVRRYIASPKEQPEAFCRFDEDTVVVDSATSEVSFDGLSAPAVKQKIITWLEKKGFGTRKVTYKLRDWLFSRQRYWGEPFPIVFDEHGLPVAVPESMLPITLPDLHEFAPELATDGSALPRPPLARASEWVRAELDLGNGLKTYSREVNTMPQWAGSCWYYLRYLDPENGRELCELSIERYWMSGAVADGSTERGGVDLYVGGVEHAVLHLLYARFWHKILYDLGHVSSPEPFQRLYNQGYVLAAAYTDSRGVYVPAAEVEEYDGVHYYQGEPVDRHSGKMGKSLKNGVSPDDVFREYGCDTLRLYEMAMGPLNASQPWNPRDIVGVYRFLARLWRNIIDEDTGASRVTAEPPGDDISRLLARTTAAVRRDIEQLSFNTAIAKLIELNNALTGLSSVPIAVARDLVLLVAPFAPHIAEELWERLGGKDTLAYHPYPTADERYLRDTHVNVPVAISGRVRSTVAMPVQASQEEAELLARQDQGIQRFLQGKRLLKVVFVPGRMLNFVVDL